jgi:hypothetical protein
MFTDVKKKTQKKFDVTILTQVVIGILDLWNASSYHSISQKILPKSSNSTYRPHRPIVRKIRYTKSYVFGALKAPKRANLLVPLILILTSIKNFFHLSLELYKML